MSAIPPLPPPGSAFPPLPAALLPLASEERWCVWRWELHYKTGKLTKVPYVAGDPARNARSNAPATWRTFEDAIRTYATGKVHGIGFMLKGAPLGAFDLDNCRDPETGEIAEWALALVQETRSYVEVTTSGTGLRIIGIAKGTKVHRNQAVPEVEAGRIETYRGCERYIVVTGDALDGAPSELVDIDADIDRLVAWLDEASAARKQKARSKESGSSRFEHDRERRDLPPDLDRLIRNGVPEGERSEAFFHVVGWLKDYGYSVADIVALLERHPEGIAAKYLGRLPGEVQRAFDKAETKPGRERPRQSRRSRSQSGSEEDDRDQADGLPRILIAAGEVPRIVDETEAVLIASGSRIYTRAGSLVRPVVGTVPAAKGRMTTIARLRTLCTASLSDHLARVIRYRRFDKRSNEWVDTNPPLEAVAALLAREGEWRLPAIAGVITTPTLRGDGTILAEPGYDPETRLFLAVEPNFALPAISAEPTRQDAATALKLLDGLLAGFPFVEPVDRAVALSGILTAVVRGTLAVAPLHAIRAHSPGTGKSLLVDIASAIATGRRCPVIAAGKTEEETEKRLGALLRDGVPVVSIDNVNGELGGDMLCQMTERPLVRVRILGRSEAPELECRSTVFATGNNLVLVGDMVRRTVLCTLDAKVERPELREFDFDPVERVLSNRAAYVAAAMTIIQAYRAAGSPRVCGPIGSYGEWSGTVRAPLIWLGCADPVASMETAREEDPELSAIRELFAHWEEHLDLNEPRTTNAIIQIACEREPSGIYPSADFQTRSFKAPEFRDLLLRIAGEGGAVNSRRLGKWLSRISGRVVSGLCIEMRVSSGHGNRFTLMRPNAGRARSVGVNAGDARTVF